MKKTNRYTNIQIVALGLWVGLLAAPSILLAEPAKKPAELWPSVIDETTGRRVYQLTDRPGNNMAFYYLFKNPGSVDGVPYLAYRNTDSSGISYYSINLNTGAEVELTQRGMVGFIADVVGEYLYCLKKTSPSDLRYSSIIRSNLKTGQEEKIIDLDRQYKYSANLSVSADGKKVLFFHPAEEKGSIILQCVEVDTKAVHQVASGKISHIAFGPVDPNLYFYIDQHYNRNWKRTGFGWVDLKSGFITNALMTVDDPFFNQSNGQLVPSHLHWDADGLPAITAVDTQKPYINEYNVVVTPDRNHPGNLLNYKKAQIRMGEFQTHFNAGPTAEWYVGDGKSADWWHKPGFGKPYIHKIRYNYETESMVQTPLADQVGTYWKSGEYEACARYISGKNLVVWNSFRTLDGKTPSFLTDEQVRTGSWEERSEPWLYSSSNDVKQNVFAVSFDKEDAAGWDFSTDTEGWTAGNNMQLCWTDGGAEDAGIIGTLTAGRAELLSPAEIHLSCADYSKLMLRIKNDSSAVNWRMYFTTEEDPLFSESKSVAVVMASSTNQYTSCFVDFSTNSSWKGTLRQIKLCPSADAVTGHFEIQVIRFL